MLTADAAVDQANDTAARYFNFAVDSIDNTFGRGYAQKNPALVAAFMNVAVLDYNTTALVFRERWANT